MNGFHFTTASHASVLRGKRPNEHYIDVSSYGSHAQFSPMRSFDQIIPVPGLPWHYARSVEGIWQGLKVIAGETDFEQFSAQRARKRSNAPYEDTRFKFGDKTIDLITARHTIYVPSYEYMFKNLVEPEAIDDLLELGRKGNSIYFYDVVDNPNINDPTAPYSHASLLADLMTQRARKDNV